MIAGWEKHLQASSRFAFVTFILFFVGVVPIRVIRGLALRFNASTPKAFARCGGQAEQAI